MLSESLVALCSTPGMTQARLRNLLALFRDPDKVIQAPESELADVPGISPELAHRIRRCLRDADATRKLKRAAELGCQSVTFLDPGYPENLRNVDHAPPVLFFRGSVRVEDSLALAIIGTRRATPYGMMVAQRLARGLGEQGVTVVSGLARGIDTAAHIGAMAGGGRTIAVLGCGLDVYYPPENRRYYDQIAEHGAVVTEFNFGTGPQAHHFPVRNRVISGMSRAVLAVEARDSSGVLNTVRWALDQGRDVLAVPGTITAETSEGTNQLIKDGARPVTGLDDLLAVLEVKPRKKSQPEIPLTEADRNLLAHLDVEPIHIDALAEKVKLTMPALLGQLLDLEMKGAIRQLPGMMFVKVM